MKNRKLFSALLPVAAIAGFILFNACKSGEPANNGKDSVATNTPTTDGGAGLKLPEGFNAAVIADKLGGTREIAVTPQGDIYVKLNHAKNGKGILFLHQEGDKATVKTGFGTFGGTGVYVKNGYLYASSDEEVFRYKLNAQNEVINPDQPEKIVTGLLSRREHEAKAITLDNDGNLYVNIGAYSNSCQVEDRGNWGNRDNNNDNRNRGNWGGQRSDNRGDGNRGGNWGGQRFAENRGYATRQ